MPQTTEGNTMECPKCKCVMNEIADESFSAMKCTGCSGIWFRDGSHEIAKTIEGISAIDENDTNAAAAYDEIRDIFCPECNKKMIKMVDKAQLHIKFEACTYCRGVFFDAGEFKDYAEHKLIERIKQAIDTFKLNFRT